MMKLIHAGSRADTGLVLGMEHVGAMKRLHSLSASALLTLRDRFVKGTVHSSVRVMQRLEKHAVGRARACACGSRHRFAMILHAAGAHLAGMVLHVIWLFRARATAVIMESVVMVFVDVLLGGKTLTAEIAPFVL